jgi:hypothetical protein
MGPVAPHTEVADQERAEDGNGWGGWARELGPVAAVRGDELLDERALPDDHDAVKPWLELPSWRTPSGRRCGHAISVLQCPTIDPSAALQVASMAEFTRAMD